jgi:general secretion pathway protein B
MSSILEALKKLEDDKAARRSGSGNLAGKVVKSGRKQQATPRWLLPAALLAVAAVSVLGTYGVMSSRPSPENRQQSAGKPAPVQSPETPTHPPASPLPATQLPPVATPVTDALAPRRATRHGSGTAPEAGRVQPAQIPPMNTAKSTSFEPGPDMPKLNVVGIAWQKDTTLRLAIVNGIPVREGGSVNGATVRDILPDRVRFSINGKTVDIPLEN